jgi:hypothetical protein
LSLRARGFGRHYGLCSSALRDVGISFAASACQHDHIGCYGSELAARMRERERESVCVCRRAIPRRARRLPRLGFRSHRCLHTHWLSLINRISTNTHWCVWSTRPTFDHHEAVMGLCRWLRTVCESVGERWRGEAGRLSGWDDDSAHSLTPMLAHILARAVDANGFGPSRSGGETVPVAAHSCESVGERRHTGAVFFLTLCTTSEIGYTQYKCSCARCMHSRMQLSSLHLNEDAGSAGFFSEDCFHGQILTVWEAYP